MFHSVAFLFLLNPKSHFLQRTTGLEDTCLSF